MAQVVERRPLDRDVRGSNPSHDTMALLLGRHYEFPQCGKIKGKLLIIIIIICSVIRNCFHMYFRTADVVYISIVKSSSIKVC
jgi:hypothetical protein